MTEQYKFCCETCFYYTNLKQNYNKHIESAKHKNKIQPSNENTSSFRCESCNTCMKTKSGLWKHKKICKAISKVEPPKSATMEDINEIKKLLTQILEGQNQPRNEIVTTNSNNNNIAIFLNEKCGNAVDIRDFCKAMEVMEEHFKTVGEKGYLIGMAEILQHNLSKYTLFQRPIHCIKDKDDEQNDQIHIRYNKTWTPETRESNFILKSAVDEIDEKVHDEFKTYTEENGKMQNHDRISNRLLNSWDMKDETTNKLLEIVIVDVDKNASNNPREIL